MKQHYDCHKALTIEPTKNGYLVSYPGYLECRHVFLTFAEVVQYLAEELCLVSVGERVRVESEGET